MRRCADCKQDLPDDQFTKSNPWYCRKCKNERHKRWIQKKRDERLAIKTPEIPRTHKLCPRCNETKPVDEFYLLRGRTLHYVCKPCSSTLGQQRRALRDAKGERGYERLKFRCNRVGTTVDWYLAQEQKQGGVCALCGRPESHPHFKGSDQIRALAIDHDHATGKVRGLLCFRCNTALYQLELNGTDWAHKAVAYLDEHKE